MGNNLQFASEASTAGCSRMLRSCGVPASTPARRVAGSDTRSASLPILFIIFSVTPMSDEKKHKDPVAADLDFKHRAELFRREIETSSPPERSSLARRLEKRPGYKEWLRRQWLRRKLKE